MSIVSVTFVSLKTGLVPIIGIHLCCTERLLPLGKLSINGLLSVTLILGLILKIIVPEANALGTLVELAKSPITIPPVVVVNIVVSPIFASAEVKAISTVLVFATSANIST